MRVQVSKFAALAELITCLMAVASSGQQTVAAAPPPIYWRQNLLTVPYQWSTPAGEPNSKSVRLYVSKDRGANWKLVADGESRLLSFNYRAEADGEYWFALRTAEVREPQVSDVTGMQGALRPELKVIVDTTAPQIESLTAQQIDAATLEIRWRANDANLGTQSCSAEVQLGPKAEWQAVPPGSESQVSAGVWEGVSRFVLPTGDAVMAVRASVSDLAGNRARSQTLPGGKAVPLPDAPALSAPPNDLMGWTSGPAPSVVENHYAAAAEPQLWPADRSGRLPPLETDLHPGAVAYGAPITRGAAEITPVPAAGEASIPEPATEDRPLGLVPPSRDQFGKQEIVDDQRIFRTASLPAPSTRSTVAKPESNFQIVPPPANPLARRVNSRSFALEYELANVGDRGIAKVEAWGTHDGGQSWQRYAVDSDNRSPLDVTVDGEGEYGFTIVVTGAANESSMPPQPGDTPALWVDIDLEPPLARILEVNAARGLVGGELTVSWEANDDHLEPRPIALFYSSRPAGPWTPIATGIENRGEFTWPIERHVPRRVYLKLEARDAAGNVAAFQTAEPIVTESEPAMAKWQRLPPVQ